MKKTLIFYTGIGSHKSGLHTPSRFLKIIKALRKNNGIKTPSTMTVSQLANWAGAYKFVANVKKNGIEYNGRVYKGAIGS
jgi:hypothetical protein